MLATSMVALLHLSTGCGSASPSTTDVRDSKYNSNVCAGTTPAWQGTCNVLSGDTGTAIESYYYCETSDAPVNVACPANFTFSSNTCKQNPNGAWACQQNCVESINCGTSKEDTIKATVTTGTNDDPCVCGCTKLTSTQACAQGSCATVSDGCGGTIACKCQPGYTCGGAAQNYQCGPECQPNVCGANGVECGSAPNGCGGTIQCGVCGTGYNCVNNQCSCVPETCDPDECGTYDDGCGGTIDCIGGCGGGYGGGCVDCLYGECIDGDCYIDAVKAPRTGKKLRARRAAEQLSSQPQ